MSRRGLRLSQLPPVRSEKPKTGQNVRAAHGGRYAA